MAALSVSLMRRCARKRQRVQTDPDTELVAEIWDHGLQLGNLTKEHMQSLKQLLHGLETLCQVALLPDEHLADDDLPSVEFVQYMFQRCTQLALPMTLHRGEVLNLEHPVSLADVIALALAATVRWELDDEVAGGGDDDDELDGIDAAALTRLCGQQLSLDSVPDVLHRFEAERDAFIRHVRRVVNALIMLRHTEPGAQRSATHAMSCQIRWHTALLHVRSLYRTQPSPLAHSPWLEAQCVQLLFERAARYPVQSNTSRYLYDAVRMCFLPIGSANEYFKFKPTARGMAGSVRFLREREHSPEHVMHISKQTTADPSVPGFDVESLDPCTVEVWVMFYLDHMLVQVSGDTAPFRSSSLVAWWDYSSPEKMKRLVRPFDDHGRRCAPCVWQAGLGKWAVLFGYDAFVCESASHAVRTWLSLARHHGTPALPAHIPVFDDVG